MDEQTFSLSGTRDNRPHKSIKSSFGKELKHQIKNERLQKLIDNNAAFLQSLGSNPMYDAVIDEIDGRKIKIGNTWLVDWASCNYLGFDLDEEIIDSIPEFVKKWGTHPSWSRMLGSPILYEQLEDKITKLVRSENALVLPNLTLTNNYCLFVLSEGGEIFLDKYSHRTLYEGAARARDLGVKLTYFKNFELDHLELSLKMSKAHKKLICIDGVFSMHGKYADIPRLAKMAREYDALLYIDDAHGFGMIGERTVDEKSAYGSKGNSIVNYFGETYENVIVAACLSKAYSSYSAFLTCSKELKKFLKAVISPYLYSGPAPIASLATAHKALDVNEKRGDDIRADIYQKCAKLNRAIDRLGFRSDNTTNFPIFNVYIEDPDELDKVSTWLFDCGIYVTLCPYPMVSREDAGFRIQITASNTHEEVDYLIKVLEELQNVTSVQMEQRPKKKETAVPFANKGIDWLTTS